MDNGYFQDIYGFLSDGSLLYLGSLTVPGVFKNLNYGYVVHSDGHLHHIDDFEENDCGQSVFPMQKASFVAGKRQYLINVTLCGSHIMYESSIGWSGQVHMNCINVTLADDKGCGLSFNGSFRLKPEDLTQVSTIPEVILSDKLQFCLPLSDHCCQHPDLSGGKGSSLAKLHSFTIKDSSFIVPGGAMVTTAAYNVIVQEQPVIDAINALELTICRRNDKDVMKACERITSVFMSLTMPSVISNAIESCLASIYSKKFNDMRFAVRSSMKGEDGFEMSAAGQMETYLGIKGLAEILDCVKKCWASQFRYIAVQYKKQNGQLLNSSMAVVIQEMVPCEKAGVMFTCDSVTGNPSYITITANYGLGEAVVSSRVEPDCIMLKRNSENVLNIYSVTLGQKSMQIIMDETGGTKEESIATENALKCCLSMEESLTLGKIGVMIEEKLGFPCDIEWGIIDKKIVLLQARPVTSIDVASDFEIIHERDSFLRSEDEYNTTANVGEVLPGSLSILGLCLLGKLFEHSFQCSAWRKREAKKLPKSPYFLKGVLHFYSHCFFNIIEGLLRHNSEEGLSPVVKGTMIAVFGRVLDDEHLFQKAYKRHPALSTADKIWNGLQFLGDILFAASEVKKAVKKYANYRIQVEKYDTAKALYDAIAYEWYKTFYMVRLHFSCTFASSSCNLAVMRILAEARGDWSTDVYADFANLLATCSGVESADVPDAIKNLAQDIARNIEKERFKNMSTEEALKWLQETDTSSKQMFEDFIIKHGHRCYKELDLYSTSWGTDPRPLVETLQAAVGALSPNNSQKKIETPEEAIEHLKTPLTRKKKWLLRHLLALCRKAVGVRENSKSLVVKVINAFRHAYRRLAELMVLEGRLPEEDVIFFLTYDEIGQLIETRSARLLSKAVRRKRMYPDLDTLIFPEVIKGVPVPIQKNKRKDYLNNQSFLEVKGIPVSRGVAKGPACVVCDIKEAQSIKSGDILITYSTDIGWSPYFPLLSGIVTELGGLVSHGAVVAREYGLPCIVGLHGATQMFKTGDQVLLDADRGILQKISEPCAENCVTKL